MRRPPANARACRTISSNRGRGKAAQIHVSRLDDETAASGHGVTSIDDQVQEDLLDPARIGAHLAEILVVDGHELDVFTDQAA